MAVVSIQLFCVLHSAEDHERCEYIKNKNCKRQGLWANHYAGLS
jgi:hypothetical protein